jgi:hypothetical protein
MNLDPVYEMALSSPAPVEALRALAMNRLAQGHDRSVIAASFEEARRQLRLADREADEDAMMDAMDCLIGWCSPHMVLTPVSDPSEQADSIAAHDLGVNPRLEKKRI